MRNLWEICEKFVRKLYECCEKVVHKLCESCEKVVRKLWESCVKVVWKLWQSCEKVVRKMWESCEKVVKKSTALLQLQTMADMCVLVCSHATSQNWEVTVRNRRPYDHGHGKNTTTKAVNQSSLSKTTIYRKRIKNFMFSI